MAQDFVQALYRWLLSSAGLLKQLSWLLLAVLVASAALWVALRKLDPQGEAEWRPKLASAGKTVARLAALVISLLLLSGVLVQLREMITVRQDAIEQASASRRKEPRLSGVVQFAPNVAILQLRTYTRTLTMPPNFLDRIGSDGVQVLSPYLTDPSADDVLKLVDSFKRSGRDVVFTREVTRRDQFNVAADAADVSVAFESQGARNGQVHYEVKYDGTYRFHNPNAQPATMRFNFPPPQGGGTIQGFYFDIAGRRVTEPDEHGQYVWSGVVPPGQSLTATAHYRVTGAGNYVYTLGSEQRRIGDFHLSAKSDRELKFGRAGIFPTNINGTEAQWRLRDVLTSQSINMQISRSNIQNELFDKTLSLLPLVLVLFGVAAWWFMPGRAAAGVCAYAAGLVAIPVLSAYIAPVQATIFGAILAAILGGAVLRDRRAWVAAVGSAVTACAFISQEHGTLVVFVVASATLVVLLLMRPSAGSPAEVGGE